MWPSFANTPITIIFPSKSQDSRFNVVLNYDDPEKTIEVLGWVNPGSTGRTLGGVDVSTDGQTVLLPEGTPVTSICAVEVHGVRYLVDGEPRRLQSPTGALTHVEAPLKAFTPEG